MAGQLTSYFNSFHSTTAVRMASPAAVGGASCHRISKGVTYYVRESDPNSGPPPGADRPLLLLFPWMGARPQALAKYFQAYSRTGCDMLAVETEISAFLWPRWGLDYGATVLELLQSERFASRPLLVHASSIGGFTFTQVLVHLSRDTRRYRGFAERIEGQVYDSLVLGSVERMAIGEGFKKTFSRRRWCVAAMLDRTGCRDATL